MEVSENAKKSSQGGSIPENEVSLRPDRYF